MKNKKIEFKNHFSKGLALFAGMCCAAIPAFWFYSADIGIRSNKLAFTVVSLFTIIFFFVGVIIEKLNQVIKFIEEIVCESEKEENNEKEN